MSTAPPGWYADPWRHAPLRWWDGNRWTEHTSDWGPARPAVAINQPSPADLLAREQRVTPWLRAVLFLWPIATALSLGGLVTAIDRFGDIARRNTSSTLPTFWWVAQFGGLIGIAVLVLRIVWLYRAASVARSLGLETRREPLHSAIGWLIPVINYWWPYQGMTDLFPEGERPDRRIAWWWATSIISGLSLFIVIAVPFVPVGVAVGLVALALAPALVAAALEVALVGEALAIHARLVAH